MTAIAETGVEPIHTRIPEAWADVAPMIDGDATGKNLLSMHQLTAQDIADYVEEARAAEAYVDGPQRGVTLLPHAVLKAVMRQPSTRTGGSMTTAMAKLGGEGDLISGMASSSEAKGESLAHTWVAFATQSDIIGIRSKENDGPYLAAHAIKESLDHGKLRRPVPVINLGNGTDEHVTQALGDFYTIARWQNFDLTKLRGMTLSVVGDHERYRAFHSLLIGAAALKMNVITVESSAAPVPDNLLRLLGSRLTRTGDFDQAMRNSDVLYVGRNPDEYDGNNPEEHNRSQHLATDYARWIIDNERLQQMPKNSIVLHPRPIKNELNPDVEGNPRMWDVEQMSAMIPMRMAIIARHLGSSIAKHAPLLREES